MNIKKFILCVLFITGSFAYAKEWNDKAVEELNNEALQEISKLIDNKPDSKIEQLLDDEIIDELRAHIAKNEWSIKHIKEINNAVLYTLQRRQTFFNFILISWRRFWWGWRL